MGGYSTGIIADQRFVFPLPEDLSSAYACSMLCGGLTVYSPLVRNGAGPGKKVGVIGIGGLVRTLPDAPFSRFLSEPSLIRDTMQFCLRRHLAVKSMRSLTVAAKRRTVEKWERTTTFSARQTLKRASNTFLILSSVPVML